MAPSTAGVGIEQESPSFCTASEKQNMRRFRQLADEELHVVPGAAKEGPNQFLPVVFAPLLSTQKGKRNDCKSNHSQLKILNHAALRYAVQDDVVVWEVCK